VTVDNGCLTDTANREPDGIFHTGRDPVRCGPPADHQSRAYTGKRHPYSRGKTFPSCNAFDNAVSVAHGGLLRIKRKPDMGGANASTSGLTPLQLPGSLQ
jgi:hypothetical protein